jgi:hypothetical protein
MGESFMMPVWLFVSALVRAKPQKGMLEGFCMLSSREPPFKFDSHGQMPTAPFRLKKEKPNLTIGDFDDVTLGSPAVFQIERLKRRRSRESGSE